ncbi:glycosyltransferase family 2 protein [Cellulomonas telluris]|uniref:glycosyltransferase family 2 protein n=1 Tax=Cellulomonas telluris TaxID=2306636 RepID=UPI0010A923D2|nr:glycosyltransferase [Cellulomonas telluris]
MTAVSVVLPVYQAEAFVTATLERLTGQTLDDLEVVVVDDGSTDGTAAACRAVAARDPRVRVLELGENRGVSQARAAAVAAARGEHLWLVDADDVVPPDAAATLLAAARSAGADVVVGRADVVRTGGTRRPVPVPAPGRLDGDAPLRALLRGEITGHLWNKLFRREVLAPGPFVPARVHSDLALVAGALARARSAVCVPELVYEYRIRPGSVVTTPRSRAESLDVVGAAVSAAARTRGIGPGDPDHDYFRCRYITLSAVKDLVRSQPDGQEARLRALRRELGPRQLRLLAARGDARRLALALTARCSLPAHRALLALAER